MAPSPQRRLDQWNQRAASYDAMMSRVEQRFLADSRRWIGERAGGATLEVAVGTGANLPYYDDAVTLTGIDWSEAMLAQAARRAAALGRTVDLHRSDAMALPFPDAGFDTVVCTFSFCSFPDERRALAEAARVLRPGLAAARRPCGLDELGAADTATPRRSGQRAAAGRALVPAARSVARRAGTGDRGRRARQARGDRTGPRANAGHGRADR